MTETTHIAAPESQGLGVLQGELDTAARIESKLRASVAGFAQFRATAPEVRAAMLLRAAAILEENVEPLAHLMTQEMGKIVSAARAEALKCATVCRFYAEHGASMLADEPTPFGYLNSVVRFQPLGTVLAIMPWNFPFWQVFRFAAPALMAGNCILLKHAPNVPGCARKVEEIFEQAGVPGGVFQNLYAEPATIERVIGDERIAGVTLTGSEAAGSSVGASAGRAIKRVVLELGGSDPFLIFPSADRVQAVATAVRSRMLNSGQSCIAAKRILIHGSIYDEALAMLIQEVAGLRVGDPLDERTDIGPLAQARFAGHLEDQVTRALGAGAILHRGGRRRTDLGPAFYEPTVLSDLPRDTPIAREEFFGPVMLVSRFRTLEEAIAIANDSPFGLGASVWSTDAVEQLRLADELECGQLFFNAMVHSDPRLPFGGIKRSGIGRELGVAGIREFTNSKSISFG